jgi:two-component system, sensor histidine kinase and response regulator
MLYLQESPVEFITFPSLSFPSGVKPVAVFSSEQALKDWVWKRYRDEIFASMKVHLIGENIKTGNCKLEDDDDGDKFSVSTMTNTTGTRSSSKASSTVEDNNMALTATEVMHSRKSRIIDLLEEEVADRTLKLQEANTALEKANSIIMEEAQRQLEHFACMSHEIRTPLNCIIGLSNLLVQDTTDFPPKYVDSIKMINSSGELLLTVVNDVLDYAKYEAGKIDFDIIRTNLQETLDSIVRPISTKAYSERGIKMRCFYNVNVPAFVHTDPRRLQQILFNLLGNAVKFSPNNGLIELHAKVCPIASYSQWCSPLCGKGEVNTPATVMRDAVQTAAVEQRQSSGSRNSLPPREVSLPAAIETTNVLRFIVKDHGKGIKECDFERIFQPFLQASDEKDNVYGGTGLGLPITGKLVKGLNGNIYVDSVEGEWTAFTVDLPFVDQLPDNFDTVSAKMSNTTVFFVYDDCFPGTVAHFEHCCNLYKVQKRSFANFDEMDAFVDREGNLDLSRTYICFCFESQYQAKSYARLAAQVKSVLLTFGPQQMVRETQGHYACPNSVLPTVLMESFCSYAHGTSAADATDVPHSSIDSFANLKILVAEDNLVNQKVLRMMLNKLDLTDVDMVNNGQEAVDQEARREYNVLLLDMQMPVMDGLEACQLIRQRYQHRKYGPKVAFVTAQVTGSLRSATVAAGAKSFLAKPFTLQGIKQCLEELLAPDAVEVVAK